MMTEVAFKGLDLIGPFFKRLEWLSRIILIGSAAMFVMMLLANRTPPLQALPHEPISVRPGEWSEVSVPVTRDLSRRCSVTYSRRVVDSDGSKFDLPGGGESAESIRNLSQVSAGQMRLMVLMPPARAASAIGIDFGPGQLITTRSWVCNPAQAIWPIQQTHITPIYVQRP
jgi:hypothetical protein